MPICKVKNCVNKCKALGFCAKHYQRYKKYGTPKPTREDGFIEKTKNLIGIRFGRLLVVVDSGKRNKRGEIIWTCLCDCTNIKDIVGTSLTRGLSNSCGCLRKEQAREQRQPKHGFPATYYHIFDVYRWHAIKRNYSFELSLEQFVEITQQTCYYCGQEPSNILKSKYGRENFIYNGVDRINNNEGYVLGNVVSACLKCNWAKHVLSQEAFINWVFRIGNHQRLKFIHEG